MTKRVQIQRKPKFYTHTHIHNYRREFVKNQDDIGVDII